MLFKMSAPCDLHVMRESTGGFPANFILEAVRLGYRTFAVDHHVCEPEQMPKGKKPKGKKKGKNMYKIDKVQTPKDFMTKLSQIEGGEKVKILSRLTIEFSSNDMLREMHQQMKSFDIIALRPKDQKTLERVSQMENATIISLDTTQSVGYFINKHICNAVRQRNLMFELDYGRCVMDSTVRQNTIRLAQELLVFCKGRNLILSSGFRTVNCLRAPYDVVNLAVLFGMTTNQAKETVFGSCLMALKHSELARTMKASLEATKLTGSKEEEENGAMASFSIDRGRLGEEDKPPSKKHRKR